MLKQLRERGVLRVAASYAVIAWLVLQIASVVFDPLGVPKWAMTALIIAAGVGFPIAVALAWFLEIGEHGVQVDHAADGVSRPQARGLRHYADAIVIGLLLIAVAVLLVRQSDFARPKRAENPAIAVMPFENLSRDPDQEYFADGLAEEMLDRLGRVPGLRVIARSSSFAFRGKETDALTVAERLGVTALLEGSVRRDGRRLKLTARLIDGKTGQQAWSGSYDRELTDIFAVQAELASAVVDAIIPAARGAMPANATPPTTDLQAYDLYLLARAQLALRTPNAIRRSADLARQAVRADPQFAQAWASLSTSLLFIRMYDDLARPEESAALVREAEAAVFRALSIDSSLSEAHNAYAVLLRETRKPGVEEEFKRAIELNPNNASAWHDYAVYLGNYAGRPAEASKATARSLALDPRQPTTWVNYLSSVLDPGSKRFRAEFDRAVRTVGDMPFALDRLTLPGMVTTGFPDLILRAGIAKRRMNTEENLPDWVNSARAWLMVDPDLAARRLPEHVSLVRHGMDFSVVRGLLQAEISGARGDFKGQEAEYAALLQQVDRSWEPAIRSIIAFWLTAQERDVEAAQSLAAAGDLPDMRMPPALGNDRDYGLLDLVQIRALRASGHGEEAGRLARQRLAEMRDQQSREPSVCQWDGWARYANLAANEGLRDETVKALESSLDCGDLPYHFQPALPWFKSLEGYAPYDALVRERARRIAVSRKELLRMEAEAAAAEGSNSLQSTASSR